MAVTVNKALVKPARYLLVAIHKAGVVELAVLQTIDAVAQEERQPGRVQTVGISNIRISIDSHKVR